MSDTATITAAMRVTEDTINSSANAGEVTEARVLDALRVVEDPDLHRDIVTLGFVKDIKICDGNVAFKVELTTPACPVKDLLKMQAHDAVAALPGVTQVAVEMTAQVRGQKRTGQELIPKVRHVIAVASGKGGVGKSTVAVNLAVALAQMGAKVGLMDADIYGPSLPLMMGVDKKPLLKDTPDGPKMVPVACHGVLMISLGFLLDPDKAVIWRGPMVAGTVRQLLADVLWGEQDYLIVDLPPGTGDAPLTLAQQVPISGVVVVMTPQTGGAGDRQQSHSDVPHGGAGAGTGHSHSGRRGEHERRRVRFGRRRNGGSASERAVSGPRAARPGDLRGGGRRRSGHSRRSRLGAGALLPRHCPHPGRAGQHFAVRAGAERTGRRGCSGLKHILKHLPVFFRFWFS